MPRSVDIDRDERDYEGLMITDGNGNAEMLYKPRFKHFMSKYPNRKFTFQVKVFGNDEVRNQQRFIFYIIGPALQRGFKQLGFRFTVKEAIDQAKWHSPIMVIEEMIDGEIEQRVRSMSNGESDTSILTEFIQDAIIFACMHLHTIIPDPDGWMLSKAKSFVHYKQLSA